MERQLEGGRTLIGPGRVSIHRTRRSSPESAGLGVRPTMWPSGAG